MGYGMVEFCRFLAYWALGRMAKKRTITCYVVHMDPGEGRLDAWTQMGVIAAASLIHDDLGRADVVVVDYVHADDRCRAASGLLAVELGELRYFTERCVLRDEGYDPAVLETIWCDNIVIVAPSQDGDVNQVAPTTLDRQVVSYRVRPPSWSSTMVITERLSEIDE